MFLTLNERILPFIKKVCGEKRKPYLQKNYIQE